MKPPVLIEVRRQIADRLVAGIEWCGDTGKVTCPGRQLHSHDDDRHATVYLDKSPTLNCWHTGACRQVIDPINYNLRRDCQIAELKAANTNNKAIDGKLAVPANFAIDAATAPTVAYVKTTAAASPTTPKTKRTAIAEDCTIIYACRAAGVLDNVPALALLDLTPAQMTATMLRLMFRADEWVALASNVRSVCVTYSVAALLAHLDAGNSINSLLCGRDTFVKINPVRPHSRGCAADVTAYRWGLVECDSGLTPEQQLEVYRRYQLPYVVRLYSGGKSVHNITPIFAADQIQYRVTLQKIYNQLGEGVDSRMHNVDRYCRLGGGLRGGKLQPLLAINPIQF